MFWQDIIRSQLSKRASCDFVKKVYMYRQDAYSENVTRRRRSIQRVLQIYVYVYVRIRVYAAFIAVSVFDFPDFLKRP
jgi:hypothetical protein